MTNTETKKFSKTMAKTLIQLRKLGMHEQAKAIEAATVAEVARMKGI